MRINLLGQSFTVMCVVIDRNDAGQAVSFHVSYADHRDLSTRTCTLSPEEFKNRVQIENQEG